MRALAIVGLVAVLALAILFAARGELGTVRGPDSAAPSGSTAVPLHADPIADPDDLALRDAPSMPGRSRSHVPSSWAFTIDVVREDTGEPVAGVLVGAKATVSQSSHPPRGPDPVRGVTDANGRVVFDLVDGVSWSIRTLGAKHEVTAEERAARHVTLRTPHRPPLVFHGRVVDLEGNRITGGRALVVPRVPAAKHELAWPPVDPIVCPCDADGVFRVELDPWRDVVAIVEAPGWSKRIVTPVEGHAERSSALAIGSSPSARIVFRALAADGSPLAGADLRVEYENEYLLGQASDDDRFWTSTIHFVRHVVLDGEGRARVAEMPTRGSYRLSLSRGGVVLRRATPRSNLSWKEPLVVQWRLGSGAVVSGALVDVQGHGLPAFALRLFARGPSGDGFPPEPDENLFVARTTSDADGRFTFTDVQPGSWQIAPDCRANGASGPCEIVPTLVSFVLGPEEREGSLNVRVERGLYIDGRVLEHDGSPARDVKVSNRDSVQTTTGFDGTFVLGPLPYGECRLWAATRAGQRGSIPVSTFAGAHGVELRLLPEGRIEGRISGGTGALVSVWLQNLGTAGSMSSCLLSTENGRFTFAAAPGPWSARATDKKGGLVGFVPRFEVPVGGDVGVEITLQPSATLRFDAAAASEPRLVDVIVGTDVWERVVVGPTSERHSVVVRAGLVRLRILDESAQTEIATRELELAPGESRLVSVAELGG